MTSNHETPYSKPSALVLWLAWIFGFGGMHRVYLGKPVSGVLYFLTWGLFGVGQLIDLVRLPGMVDTANARALGPGPVVRALPDSKESMRRSLLRAAKEHGNQLSVSQGVMATGKDFAEVEAMLDEMAASGYVEIGNHPETGVVVYLFGDL